MLALCVAESRLTTQKYHCMTQRQSFLSSSRILLSTFVTFSKTRQETTGSDQPISRLLFSLWQNFLQNNPHSRPPASHGEGKTKTNRCCFWSPDVLEQLSFLTFGCPLPFHHFSCGCRAVLKAWIFRRRKLAKAQVSAWLISTNQFTQFRNTDPFHGYCTRSATISLQSGAGNVKFQDSTAKWRSTAFNRWISVLSWWMLWRMRSALNSLEFMIGLSISTVRYEYRVVWARVIPVDEPIHTTVYIQTYIRTWKC